MEKSQLAVFYSYLSECHFDILKITQDSDECEARTFVLRLDLIPQLDARKVPLILHYLSPSDQESKNEYIHLSLISLTTTTPVVVMLLVTLFTVISFNHPIGFIKYGGYGPN